MKNKKSVSLIIIILSLLILVACTNNNQENQSSVEETEQNQQSKNNQNKVDTTVNHEDELTFTGIIDEINGEVALVSIEKGVILNSGSKVEVDLSVANDKTFQIGNKVKVGYDGIVRETYPLSINTTFVELIE